MGVERDSQEDVGSIKSMAAACLPETEDLWRERAQHHPVLQYSCRALPNVIRKYPERSFT